MTENRKFHGILTLSAASIALSQSVSANGQTLDKAQAGSADSLSADNAPKTANLILAPAHNEELIRLYASHSSHSSHSSHVSHASHYSGSGYSAPAYPNYSQPTQSQPIAPPQKTNSVNQSAGSANMGISTNKTSATDSATNLIAKASAADAALIGFLKERAAQGSADAQYSLAMCYLDGKYGVKKDYETARLLLDMSASRGDVEAKDEIEKLKTAADASGKAPNKP